MSALRPAAIDPVAYRSLGALLDDACLQFKTETALIEMSRKKEAQRLSYAEARREGRAVAAALAALGIGPGDRVAIVLTNQPRWLTTALGVFWRGATLVPLDYKLTADEQAALIAHAKPRVLVTEEGLLRRFSDGQLDGLDAIWTAAPQVDDDDVAAVEIAAQAREDLATIVYSSGTGGRPKGCLLTHGAYLSQLEGLLERFPLITGDRYFSILPTNHAIDFMCGFVGPFCGGATVVHQRTLRPEFLMDTMKRQRITHMALVPLILEAFERRIKEQLDEAPRWKKDVFGGLKQINRWLTDKRPQHALSKRLLAPVHDAFGGHLKLLFCGGAFVDPDRAQFFYDLGLPVAIGYGLTECCTVATVNDLKPFRSDSVGKTVKNVRVKIAGADATGVGEVLISGPTLMSGYLDDPELTAETLVDGWLHTGDLGHLDAAGHLHLVGRRKNMIVTAGGKNIYPEDIEIAFADVACAELCVFAEHTLWPKRDLVGERLVAIVRPEEDGPSDVFGALRAANGRLADFKRVAGVLPWDEAFPRTASMKLKRNELAATIRTRLDASAVQPLHR